MPLPQKKLIPGILLALVIAAIAAPPLWWGEGNPPVIDPAAAENNKGPANIGQAKHMAKSALDALRAVLPAVADQIEADLVGNGKPIPSWAAPANQAERDKNHAPLLIGQLKAIADPFYTRLHAASPHWLEAERTANGTHHPSSIFPWTSAATDDNNKGMANIGQLKAVFALHFETLAAHDHDGDGMTDIWEISHGFFANNPADANADPDGDGIPNHMELALVTDPNSFNPIGPANIGFDEIEDPLSPDLNFRPENPSDLYPDSSVPHWNAAIGQHIEIWKEDDGDTYAELQSHWDAKGIEQEFDMLPGTRLTFILRYKGRYDGYSDSNPFKLKVEGAHAVLVNGQPAQTQGSVKQHSFMADDTWEKYAEWHYASVSITADPLATKLVPITLTLIPEDTDEAITYGGFVDLIPAEFKLKDPADVAKGWDDTGNDPWTSVGVGKTKSIVKFVGGSGDFELVVAPGSAGYLSIANQTVTGGDTNFTITGNADSKNLGAGGAKIIFRKKATTVALTTLHVHVLPEQIVPIKLFHGSDNRIAATALPANLPTVTEIATELNATFSSQANVTFSALSAAPSVLNDCYGAFASDGKFYSYDEGMSNALFTKSGAGNFLRIYLIKDIIGHDFNGGTIDLIGVGFRLKPLLVVEPATSKITFSHETAHCLGLTDKTLPNGDRHEPEDARGPFGVMPLMHSSDDGLTRWIRQEDWRAANTRAGIPFAP